MEAFSIICESCAAKLKVRNAALIGQKLACPKCGDMITVEAPEGWVTPKPEAATDSSESDFEDIDTILKQQTGTTPAPTPAKRKQSAAAAKKKRQNQATPAGVSSQNTANKTEATPILPDDNWTADSTKSHRKLTTVIAATIAGLVIIGAVTLAIYANLPADDVAVAEKSDDKKPVIGDSISKEQGGQADSNIVTENEPKPSAPPANEIENDNNTQHEAQPIENVNEAAATSIADTPEPTPTENQTELPGEQIAEPTPVPPVPETNVDNDTPPTKRSAASPFDEIFEQVLNPRDDQPKNVETNFNELSDALENAGTTLSEINQFASIDRRQAGIPKYFVDQNARMRPLKKPLGLALPCAGVQYNGHSLPQILNEIEQITATPISLDSDQLKRIGFDFGGTVKDLLIKDAGTFKDVLTETLAQYTDETVLVYDGGISPAIVTTEAKVNSGELKIPFPDLTSMTADDLAKLLRDLIAPGSWSSEGNGFKTESTGTELHAVNLPLALSKIEVFFQKWNTANTNDVAKSELQSTFSKASQSLGQNCDMNTEYPQPIREFFADLQVKTGLNFLIDFASLTVEGWSPRSTIPPDVSEATVGDLLDEICHSMKITFRAIDEKTFELLTLDEEKRHRDLEFYDCTTILNGPLNTEQMMELLRQSIQSAGYTPDDMRAYFANEINCFIVVAPQSIQRKIESILKRLEEL